MNAFIQLTLLSHPQLHYIILRQQAFSLQCSLFAVPGQQRPLRKEAEWGYLIVYSTQHSKSSSCVYKLQETLYGQSYGGLSAKLKLSGQSKLSLMANLVLNQHCTCLACEREHKKQFLLSFSLVNPPWCSSGLCPQKASCSLCFIILAPWNFIRVHRLPLQSNLMFSLLWKRHGKTCNILTK